MSRKRIDGIDVMISHSNRPEIAYCIETLANNKRVNKILIGNLLPERYSLNKLVTPFKGKLKIIDITPSKDEQFNKGKILNRCFKEVESLHILLSDADILWNDDTIEQMLNQPPDIVSVIRRVEELDQEFVDNKKNTINVKVHRSESNAIVDITVNEIDNSSVREGCGLVLTRAENFETIGGFKEIFRGWGWEDQDLLIRAQLLGFRIRPLGHAVHITHGDEKRNLVGIRRDKTESRNQNFRLALDEIKAKKLYGPLNQIIPVSQNDILVKGEDNCKKLTSNFPY